MPIHHSRDWAPGWQAEPGTPPCPSALPRSPSDWPFAPHSAWVWDVPGITVMVLLSFQRPSASGSSPKTGGQRGSSCMLSTYLRCPLTSANSRLWPYTGFDCVNAGAGPPSCPLSQHTPSPPPQPPVWHCCSRRAQANPHGLWELGEYLNFCEVISVRLGTKSPKTIHI